MGLQLSPWPCFLDREGVSFLWDKMKSILKQIRTKMKQKMVGVDGGEKEREKE